MRHSVIATQKFINAVHQGLLIVGSVEHRHHAHGIAKKESFVQHLTPRKPTAGDIPRQTKQFDAIARSAIGSCQVTVDILCDWAIQRLIRGNQHQAGGAQKLQYLDHSWIHLRENIACSIERCAVRRHHTPLIDLGIGFRCA